MRRPPQPIYADPCPTCGKRCARTLHDGCPVLESRRAEKRKATRDRARLFGIGKAGAE